MILMKNDFRVALVTTHIPVREIATTITKELIQEKLMIFHHCLKQDFGIGAPRIAVLSLNPHAGDGGLLGTEEQEVIIPAMKEMEEKDSLLRTLCCRRLYGIGQLYAFRRNIGDVPRPGAGSVQGVGYG